MRGAEADADAAFVAALAADWGLAVTVEVANVPALARADRMAPEEAARRARYAFLTRVAVRSAARTIAVAHNADDQVETVLMHFLRGSGLAGLRGMLPAAPLGDMRLEIGDSVGAGQSPISDLQSLNLIRPLLDIPRADIEAYCTQHDLHPRFDRSNLDTTYFRNRLRLDLIPYLETYNPNIREVLRRTAAVITADHDLLHQELDITLERVVRSEAERAIVFDLAGWRALPLALQRSTLREAIHRLRRALRNIDFVHVEHAIDILSEGETGAQVTLPQGLMLTIGYDTFIVSGGHAGTVADEAYQELPDLPLLSPGQVVPLAVPGRTPLAGWVVTAEMLPGRALSDRQLAAARGWEAYLDAAALGPSPALRTRRPGDRFDPLGMQGRSKRLNEFMINEKIPAAWRDFIPLLVDQADHIVWVCGWRPAERARVTRGTQQVVHLRFIRH
jgi:tRNA(Ile)-lysidine synthase